MNFGIVSLFPEMFTALNYGITGRALEKKLINLHFFNPRDFTCDIHKTVDDRPYGGGPGMVMKIEPLRDAVAAAKKKLGDATRVIYLTPQGKKITQNKLKQFGNTNFIFISGRYEGIDERFIESEVDEEWSIGDYVLSGGELAVMVVIDALARLHPQALGDQASATQDSFMNGFLDYPHYTRPEEVDGKRVPSVLTSGNHEAIARWRRKVALGRTWQRRPDLLANQTLSHEDNELLAEYIQIMNGEKNEQVS